MKRTLEPLILPNSPLVLVLAQVKIAAVRNMEEYIPKIQDSFRRNDYPIDVSGEVQEVLVGPGQPKVRRRPHWEFRKRDERWSIIVGDQSIIVQTSAYSTFDDFLQELELAVETVNSIVGELVVERVGLRYIDLVRPESSEEWRSFLKSGFHGVESDAFDGDTATIFYQMSADTGSGRMIARVAQNRDGLPLPPDLADHPPKIETDIEEGELFTLLDLDHFRIERFDFDKERLLELVWTLHDNLDILFRDMVTDVAIERWS